MKVIEMARRLGITADTVRVFPRYKSISPWLMVGVISTFKDGKPKDALINVILAKARIYKLLISMDPGLHRDDKTRINQSFPKHTT